MEVHAIRLEYKDYKLIEALFGARAEERAITDKYGYLKYLTVHLPASEAVLVFSGPYNDGEEF